MSRLLARIRVLAVDYLTEPRSRTRTAIVRFCSYEYRTCYDTRTGLGTIFCTNLAPDSESE
eukprot:scaffold445645_cov35-Prasinocladus_malaysianus.AAC.1